MIFLRPLGHIDVWPVATSLYRHRPLLSGENGCKRLYLRPLADEMGPIIDKWKSLTNLVSRAERLLSQHWPQFELGDVYIEQIEPNVATEWRHYNEPHFSVHVGLVTNPLALLYSGPEMMSLQTGQIAAVDEKQWHSAVNFDPMSSRYHLVLSLETKNIALDIQ